MTIDAFPQNFIWGVSTAGHQIEGNNHTSDTWYLEHVTPTVFAEVSGPGCDSYTRWEEDLDMVTSLGLTAYRFSVEWARIEPRQGVIDEDAVAHYAAIVDGCLQRGLAPMVTFNHFTAPHWFAMLGGWLNPASAELFADYCGVIMDRFGSDIAFAVTLNEPNLPQVLQWSGIPEFVHDLERATLEAASAKAGVPRYRVGNVVLAEEFGPMQDALTRAHLAARKAIKARRPDLPVGLSIAIVDDVAAPGGEALRDRKRDEVYDHWLRLAADDDFLGIQNYEQISYGPHGQLPARPGVSVNAMGTAIEPASLVGAIRYAYSVSGVPILVTEHGLGTPDDTLRANFISAALDALKEELAAGTPILGYCHWSLMDNFEWISGYDTQFGLYEVDRETFDRTPKPSARAYARYVAAQAAVLLAEGATANQA